MKIILDTNVYFSAYAFDKTILKLVDYCLINYNIYISNETISELKTKFLGGKMAKICKNFEHQRAIEYLQILENKLVMKSPTTKINICRDPRDNMFLELAKEIQADYLITGDNDLLELNKFETTKILKPSEFIELLKPDL